MPPVLASLSLQFSFRFVSEQSQTSYRYSTELIGDPVNQGPSPHLGQRWLGARFLISQCLTPWLFFVKTQLISTNNSQVNWNHGPRSHGHLRRNIGEFISRPRGLWVEIFQNSKITFGPHVIIWWRDVISRGKKWKNAHCWLSAFSVLRYFRQTWYVVVVVGQKDSHSPVDC